MTAHPASAAEADLPPLTAGPYRKRIGARNGTESECFLLDEPVDSPLLTMDRITHDSNGRVVEVASHLYRASRHEYAMTLVDRR